MCSLSSEFWHPLILTTSCAITGPIHVSCLARALQSSLIYLHSMYRTWDYQHTRAEALLLLMPSPSLRFRNDIRQSDGCSVRADNGEKEAISSFFRSFRR